MYVKIFIYLLCVGSTLALKKIPECDIEKAVRNCLKDGLLRNFEGEKIHEFPTTKEGLNKACDDLKKSEECSRKFINQCTESSNEQRALETLLDGAQRVGKRLCRSNTKKAQLIENVGCANAVIQDTKKCLKNYKMLVFAANKLKDKNKILRILCCKVRKVAPCIGEAMKSKGESICPKKSIDYFREMHKSLKEEMTTVVCADFERDNCDNLVVPEITEAEYRDKSVFDPLRELYKKVILA